LSTKGTLYRNRSLACVPFAGAPLHRQERQSSVDRLNRLKAITLRITPALRGGALSLAACIVLCAACGDDDMPASSMDGGTKMDGGPGVAGRPGGGMIGRRDAQVMADDPVPICDRADPVPCAAGQKCHPVRRRAAGEAQYSLYTGCVEDTGGRALGAPCERFGGSTTRYRADGLEDELYVDPCDVNLVCSPNPKIRGASSCQPACIIGLGCASSNQQCVGPNEIEAVCRDIDHCDPLTGQGCATGLSCYLDLDGTGTRAVTSCLPTPPEPIEDGQACNFGLGECRPGSSCWGPPRLPTDRWTLENLLCRPSCESDLVPEDSDAGVEDDAGIAGQCSNGSACRELVSSGIDVSWLPVHFGQCE
jgi:hypothetical protein